MKKLASILVLVFAVTFTTQAQKKRGGNGERDFKLTAEQHATLAVKKMTLTLDLSEKQQNQIKPLLMAQMAERKTAMAERKANRADKKRPTADEMYAMKNERLDKRIAMKNRMKEILNKEQLEKFGKMRKNKGKMAMNKTKGKKGSKDNKGEQRGRRS
ncbi:hypothetical protein BTO15_01990 [Polaribacter sejongensis]|uniref:DUF4890 domain-containing protein n=1 Tax=Polaribacter sejongensis TaxID=985043 RepID=A0ABM6PW44_9FLAO|nr:hypothetical protein [Polaribacter sejongensis]AUC20959.1 hypothetical protein BTO15_01990 [Polaribacter sejongensis]